MVTPSKQLISFSPENLPSPEKTKHKNLDTFQPTWVSECPWIKDSKLKGKKYVFCTSCIIYFKIGHRFLLLMGINYK